MKGFSLAVTVGTAEGGFDMVGAGGSYCNWSEFKDELGIEFNGQSSIVDGSGYYGHNMLVIKAHMLVIIAEMLVIIATM